LHKKCEPRLIACKVRCYGGPANGPCSNCRRYFIDCVYEPVNPQPNVANGHGNRPRLASWNYHEMAERPTFEPHLATRVSLDHVPRGSFPVSPIMFSPTTFSPATSLPSPDTLAPIRHPYLPIHSVRLPSIWQVLGDHTSSEASPMGGSVAPVQDPNDPSRLASFQCTQDPSSHERINQRDFRQG
jgi:hypothetical protein